MRFVLVFAAIFVVACGGDSTPTDGQTPEQIARQHCPEAAREPCTAHVVQFANGQRPAALCVNGEQWYMETPQGAVGERCSGGGTVRAIVGGS